MTSETFAAIAPTLPLAPGIYKYYDKDNSLLYVGKAKHLRKRVSSYFNKNDNNSKTRELVRRIHRIEFTIVNSEHEALLLENILIKENQPVFNIDLKDDKSYPYIVVKNEPFPRVFLTRNKIKDGSKYYGPYTSVAKVRDVLSFIKQNIQIRSCKLNLSEQNIKRGKFKVCLEYHLGNCKGPCEGLQSLEDYNDGLGQIKELLKGNVNPTMLDLKAEQKSHIEQLEFEKAAFYQNKIENLEKYKSRNTVINTNIESADVFTILEEGNIAYVNYLHVSNGTIIQTKTTTLIKKLEETKEEVLAFAIARMRQTFQTEAKEIIVPFPIEYQEDGIQLTVPKAGDKKKLIDLSTKNVDYFKAELKARKMLKLEDKTDGEKLEVLQTMQELLRLKELPVHIECFDNSNFQGAYPVAAMVSFKNGEPSKEDYRKFKIKTVSGINDFASMTEVVYRRYKRVLAEGLPIPQLIIIDGGKGQLSAAMESIDALGLRGKTTVVGLAKNREELFYATDNSSLQLDWDSATLKLIRRIRDEVHRFGITFHRDLRSKGTIKNELEDVKGIGKNTAQALLMKFKSVKKIQAASLEELSVEVGASRAAIIKEHFSRKGIT